jgi:hypothetical protein
VKVEDIRMCIESFEKQVGGEGKRKGRVFKGIEQTKVKHTHREHALRHPFECQPKY